MQIESGCLDRFLLLASEPHKAIGECVGDPEFHDLTAGHVQKVFGNSLCLIHPEMFQLVVWCISRLRPSNDVSVLRVGFAVGIERQLFRKHG